MKRVFAVLGAGFFLLNIYGCWLLVAGTVGGVGTASWLSGKLSQQVEVSRERATYATKQALASLKLELTKETKAEEVTQIKGKYTDGREFWIDIRPVTESSSKIEVRVGATGDKAASDKILKRINSYL